MSDSSTSSAGNDLAAARLRLLCAEGRWEIFEERIGETGGLDAFCVIASSAPRDIPGFVRRWEKPHRVPEKLGDLIARRLRERGWPAWLGALYHPEGVVGARLCRTAVPGVRDYFFVRTSAADDASFSRTADSVRDSACSVFGLGHLSLVGATAASFVTAALGLVLTGILPPEPWRIIMLLLAVFASGFCVALEKWAHRHYLAEDPREVVLDEVAGMALALAITGPGLWTIIAAFLAFRFFDIFKPGIHWVEHRGWPGTIVWDDLLAGLYAGGAVKCCLLLLQAIRP